MSFTVALLGGESTGKSTLALALLQHLKHQTRWTCRLVPEHLRLWCEQQGRAPLAHEQAGVAAEQARQIASAAAQPGVALVVADTTALVVAAYSVHYFQDRSLLPEALAQQRRYDLTLLMGLDLPWQADGLFRESPAARDAIDAILRRELDAAQLPYHTVYGNGNARLQQALRSLGRAMGTQLLPDDPEREQGRRPWNCEKCSDPACEHRLFTRLVGTTR